MVNNQDIIEKLILGTDEVEEVEIDGLKISLRPLNSGELTKLRKIEKKPYVMKMKLNSKGRVAEAKQEANNTMNIPMAEFAGSQSETIYHAVAWSMDVSLDAVRQFPVGLPEKIFKEVIRISELPDDLETVKQFR